MNESNETPTPEEAIRRAEAKLADGLATSVVAELLAEERAERAERATLDAVAQIRRLRDALRRIQQGTSGDWVHEAATAALESVPDPGQKPPLQAWRYADAPEAYRNAVSDPSDLDWVVFVPFAYGTNPWLSFVRDLGDPPTVVPVEGGELHLFYHA